MIPGMRSKRCGTTYEKSVEERARMLMMRSGSIPYSAECSFVAAKQSASKNSTVKGKGNPPSFSEDCVFEA